MATREKLGPSRVLCARVPEPLAQATADDAKRLGQRISDRIRAGLRSVVGSTDFEKKAVKELVKAAEENNVVEVGKLLVELAPTKKEEKFVLEAGVQVEVLGGNGRTMALKLIYAGMAKTTPEQVINYLRKKIEPFGLYERDVKKIARPVVVRTIRTGNEPKELALWSRRLNQSMSQQLNPTLIAVSRARFLQPRALEMLRQLPEETSFAEWLNTDASKPFVQSLEVSNIIDSRSAPVFVLPNGLLSPEGKDMVNDLLAAVIIEDADIIRMLGPAQVGAVARAAPYLAQIEALERGFNILPLFRKALRDRVKMRASGIKTAENFLAQGGLLGSNSESRGNEIAELWLKILTANAEAPAKMAKLSRAYVVAVKAASMGQSALFAQETYTPYTGLLHAAKVSKTSL